MSPVFREKIDKILILCDVKPPQENITYHGYEDYFGRALENLRESKKKTKEEILILQRNILSQKRRVGAFKRSLKKLYQTLME